jgi:hypothetical protein
MSVPGANEEMDVISIEALKRQRSQPVKRFNALTLQRNHCAKRSEAA